MIKLAYARYSEKSKKKLLNIIKRHHLHNGDGLSKMKEWSFLPIEKIHLVIVARENKKYIGSAVVINFIDNNTNGNLPCNLGVWVDGRHRRMGVGTKIGKLLQNKASVKLLPWNLQGIPKAFYDRVL